MNNDITYLGVTDSRIQQKFGIKNKDRLQHCFILGKSGVGKSSLLQNIAVADIQRGRAACVIDCHGDLVEDLLNFIPEHRIADVIYFNACDPDYAIGFNPLANVQPDYHHLVASSIIATIKKVYGESSWGPRLEHTLRMTLLSLLQFGDATLLDIQPMLTDQVFRNKVLERVTSPHLLSFWRNEHEKGGAGFKMESAAAVINKFGIFAASAPLRHIFGQKKQSFTMQQVIDEGKILLVNIGKGVIGSDVSSLLGSILISSIQHAALFRATQPAISRKPYSLIVDELQNYATASFAQALSECRKYGLGLVAASQHLQQLTDEIRASIFGNVGTIISFRLGAEDSRYMLREFYPLFTEADFIHLARFAFYIKLCIDGETSHGFSAISLPMPTTRHRWRDHVIRSSRNAYTSKRTEIEQGMIRQFEAIRKPLQSSLF